MVAAMTVMSNDGTPPPSSTTDSSDCAVQSQPAVPKHGPCFILWCWQTVKPGMPRHAQLGSPEHATSSAVSAALSAEGCSRLDPLTVPRLHQLPPAHLAASGRATKGLKVQATTSRGLALGVLGFKIIP